METQRHQIRREEDRQEWMSQRSFPKVALHCLGLVVPNFCLSQRALSR